LLSGKNAPKKKKIKGEPEMESMGPERSEKKGKEQGIPARGKGGSGVPG